jgi:hypothetical protein
MHFRRYGMGELTLKLQACGLSLTRRSHLGFLIYPAFAFVKWRNQRVDQRDDIRRLVSRQAAGTSTSRLLRLTMLLERHLGSWFSFPVGIRCLAVGRKATG